MDYERFIMVVVVWWVVLVLWFVLFVVGFVEGFFCVFFGCGVGLLFWFFSLCASHPLPQANSYVPHLIMEVTLEIENYIRTINMSK